MLEFSRFKKTHIQNGDHVAPMECQCNKDVCNCQEYVHCSQLPSSDNLLLLTSSLSSYSTNSQENNYRKNYPSLTKRIQETAVISRIVKNGHCGETSNYKNRDPYHSNKHGKQLYQQPATAIRSPQPSSPRDRNQNPSSKYQASIHMSAPQFKIISQNFKENRKVTCGCNHQYYIGGRVRREDACSDLKQEIAQKNRQIVKLMKSSDILSRQIEQIKEKNQRRIRILGSIRTKEAKMTGVQQKCKTGLKNQNTRYSVTKSHREDSLQSWKHLHSSPQYQIQKTKNSKGHLIRSTDIEKQARRIAKDTKQVQTQRFLNQQTKNELLSSSHLSEDSRKQYRSIQPVDKQKNVEHWKDSFVGVFLDLVRQLELKHHKKANYPFWSKDKNLKKETKAAWRFLKQYISQKQKYCCGNEDLSKSLHQRKYLEAAAKKYFYHHDEYYGA